MSAFSKALLRDEVQDYIHQFEGDSSALAFAGSPFPDITIQELLQQIEGRKRIETKLPSWYNSKGIIYPPRVHLEQTSSEVTANYKAALMKENTIIDITAGWGVDSFCFSKSSLETTSFEINARLAEISKHNATVLNAANLQVKQGNGLEEIASLDVDVIYVDPSRRHDRKGKVFFLDAIIGNWDRLPVFEEDLVGNLGNILYSTVTKTLIFIDTVPQKHTEGGGKYGSDDYLKTTFHPTSIKSLSPQDRLP